MAEKPNQATFRVNIDGNAAEASKNIASSTRLAAHAIAKYEDEVKSLSADLRRLRGNSDEVNESKAKLKKRIDEAKTSVSSLTVELSKQGITYNAAALAAKKYGNSVGKLPNLRKAFGKVGDKAKGVLQPLTSKMGKAIEPITLRISKALGPITQKFGKFGKVVAEDAKSILPSLSSALGVVAGGAALATAAVVAVGAAAVGAGAAIGAFGIHAASQAAQLQRNREALLGNAKDAQALGEQIAVLAGKVPQGTEQLNELGRELSKTRLSGKAIVDTMAAVAQATGAVDASAGAKIQELITRGQQTGRFALGQFELQGTGIDFEDVAKEYAEGAHKSVQAARMALLQGQIPLEDAAATLKRVTEKKFGDINLKNAFSLENAPKKLKEQLQLLSSGVDLSPVSKALQDAFGQLSPDAPLGAAVKTFMSTFGQGLIDAAAKGIPMVLEGFKWLVVGALKVGTAFYEMKKQAVDAIQAHDWVGLGKAIVLGIVKGMVSFQTTISEATLDLAKGVKDAFADYLKIKSPSKVFEGFGQNTVEGYAQGVERGSARASEAVQGMVPGSTSSNTTNNSPVSIEVNIHGGGGGAEGMSSPAFLAGLTHAIRDAVSQKGLIAA